MKHNHYKCIFFSALSIFLFCTGFYLNGMESVAQPIQNPAPEKYTILTQGATLNISKDQYNILTQKMDNPTPAIGLGDFGFEDVQIALPIVELLAQDKQEDAWNEIQKLDPLKQGIVIRIAQKLKFPITALEHKKSVAEEVVAEVAHKKAEAVQQTIKDQSMERERSESKPGFLSRWYHAIKTKVTAWFAGVKSRFSVRK